MLRHRYLACMILLISTFNWTHSLTFDLLQGQICYREGPQFSEFLPNFSPHNIDLENCSFQKKSQITIPLDKTFYSILIFDLEFEPIFTPIWWQVQHFRPWALLSSNKSCHEGFAKMHCPFVIVVQWFDMNLELLTLTVTEVKWKHTIKLDWVSERMKVTAPAAFPFCQN